MAVQMMALLMGPLIALLMAFLMAASPAGADPQDLALATALRALQPPTTRTIPLDDVTAGRSGQQVAVSGIALHLQGPVMCEHCARVPKSLDALRLPFSVKYANLALTVTSYEAYPNLVLPVNQRIALDVVLKIDLTVVESQQGCKVIKHKVEVQHFNCSAVPTSFVFIEKIVNLSNQQKTLNQEIKHQISENLEAEVTKYVQSYCDFWVKPT